METIKIIKTPRGIFNIKAIFENSTEAKETGFYYYFTDGNIDIFTKSIPEKEHCKYFAIVEK